MSADVDGVDVGVGLGADHEHILFRVVAPEVALRKQILQIDFLIRHFGEISPTLHKA